MEKTFFSLVIPYLIWNTASVCLQIIKVKQVFSQGILYFIRHSYIYFNQSGSANGPLWYIFRILEFTVLAPLFLLIIKNKKVFGVIQVGLVVYNIVCKIGYFDFCFFLPLYMAGGYLSYWHSEKLEENFSDEYSGLREHPVRVVRATRSVLREPPFPVVRATRIIELRTVVFCTNLL